MSDGQDTLAGLSPVKRKLLARLMQKEGLAAAADERIPRRQTPGPCPLSFSQQRLWFFNQLEPDNPFYNIPAAVLLKGRLRVRALEQSFEAIARRHESLRTSFVVVEREARQLVADSGPFALRVTDLSGLPREEREAAVRRLTHEEAHRPFDLTRSPLMRASLLRLADDEHVLLLTLHHIISDGWSIALLIREVAAYYEAFAAGRPARLPELPVQYADFAVWQRERLQGETLEGQLRYWKRQLSGHLPVLELPTYGGRPAQQTHRGATQHLVIDAPMTDALRRFSQREGVTLFMTLLAGFNVLLHHYTGQTDILVGTPIANRTRPELEGLIGFFANTLVLRTDLSGGPSFRELLARVKEVALGAYAHQDVPFEKLVEELEVERDLSWQPLFQVMMALQSAPQSELQLFDLETRLLEVVNETTKFDLTLLLAEDVDEVRGKLEHRTDLFDAAMIARMMEHFKAILARAVAHPERTISELSAPPEAALRQVLIEWNDTARPHADGRLAHELVAAQAPEAEAVVFGAQSLSYGELDRRADALAGRLRGLGVGPEVLVGICLERSPEMVVAILAALKAGGAYLPLDPAYPRERLDFMLNSARPRVVLTRRGLAERLPEQGPRVVCLDDDRQDDDRQDGDPAAAPPRAEAGADNLAYVIYTSGSTGQPKAVMMTHGALRNLIAFQSESSCAPAPRTLQFAPLSFDVSLQEIMATLCAGAALVLIDEETRYDTRELLRTLAERRVERLFLPFVALQQLAEVAETEKILPASLRQVITAGEQLKITPQIARLFAKLDGCVLDNQYGPTETHLATVWRLRGTPAGWPPLPPIGRPIDNAQVYVLDASLRPVAPWVTGELYIGGVQLARGYLGHPRQTAEKFVPHPFGGEPGARLYRTGDLARFRGDGCLEFLGRNDHQVKVRGFRVEPGEIEAVLADHPSVSKAVVLAVEDAPGDKRLVAYVVADAREAVAAGELRSFLKEKLPDYMIPGSFVLLDELPLTRSGKVDRQALPVPDKQRPELEVNFVPPRTEAEEAVAAVWREVLKVEQVGVYDNFFELGGHSLLATQVITRVRDAFQVEQLPLRRLFETPTVAGLVEALAEQRGGAAALAPVKPIRPRPADEPAVLSFAQQRLWFLCQLAPDPAVYNLSMGLRLAGRCDPAAWERTLTEITRRHEVLRTTFNVSAGLPVPYLMPPRQFHLPLIDLTKWPEAQREGKAKLLARAEAAQPFDLERGPLLRARLVRVGEEEHILLFTIHHIACDGWSMGVLVREAGALYAAYARGGVSPLPELEIQYADFAHWQREQLRGELLEEQLAYWKARLPADAPESALPTERPRDEVQTHRGAQQPFAFDAELSERLRGLSRREGVTLFMLLLAAFQSLLYRYAGEEQVAVGSPIANRVRPELETLIGFFVNTLVLRTDLSGDPTFRELLGRVREVCLGAYAHQNIPFEKLVEELQPERSLSRPPFFRVWFALQNAPMPPLELPGLKVMPWANEYVTAMFDLMLFFTETKEGLVGELVYNADLFEADTIAEMLARLQTLLRAVAADPELRLLDIPLDPGADARPRAADEAEDQFEF